MSRYTRDIECPCGDGRTGRAGDVAVHRWAVNARCEVSLWRRVFGQSVAERASVCKFKTAGEVDHYNKRWVFRQVGLLGTDLISTKCQKNRLAGLVNPRFQSRIGRYRAYGSVHSPCMEDSTSELTGSAQYMVARKQVRPRPDMTTCRITCAFSP